MARKDPTATTAKWLSGMQGASEAYKAGVAAVSVAPGQLAAASKETWAANVAAAKDRFAQNSQRVTKEQWVAAAQNKGATRLAEGAQAAEPKFATFMGKYLPAVYTIVGQLPSRGSYGANKQRAIAMMDALHNAKGTFT